MKLLMRFSAILTMLCLIAAGVSLWQERQLAVKHPPFTINQEEFVLDDFPVGEHEFVLEITNPAKVPRRIVGLDEG